MLPSSDQSLVVSEMNCLRDDLIPSRKPPFRKEVYFVLLLRFLSRTFLYVHSRNMFSCLVFNYGSTSTTPPCLTQYSRVKLAISRSLSTSSPRALLRPSSNIEWDEVQGNEDFFGTNGTPDPSAVINGSWCRFTRSDSRCKYLEWP